MSEFKKTIFISRAFNSGWIIEKLMSDIQNELMQRGFIVNSGELDYDKQYYFDVVFHERFFYATKYKNTLHNSGFLTHVDDKIKENECFSQLSWLDSCICLSPDQAEQLKTISRNHKVKAKIKGISLPPRNNQINPVTFAIFSNNYLDNRKNGIWLLELIKSLSIEQKNLLIIKLIGENWFEFAHKIKLLGVSVELIDYDRKLPNEYQLSKNKLKEVDYCIYMGLDGGAMSIYDCIELGVKVIYPRNCYHIQLENAGYLFSSKIEFKSICINELNKRLELQKKIEDRSIQHYVDSLLNEWFESIPECSNKLIENQNVEYYFPLHKNFQKLSFRRILGHLKRRLYKSIFK